MFIVLLLVLFSGCGEDESYYLYNDDTTKLKKENVSKYDKSENNKIEKQNTLKSDDEVIEYDDTDVDEEKISTTNKNIANSLISVGIDGKKQQSEAENNKENSNNSNTFPPMPPLMNKFQ